MSKAFFHDGGSHNMEIVVSLMAMIGGAAKYLNDIKKSGAPFSWVRFLLKVITCWFVGFTAWNAAIGMGWNVNIAVASSNFAAWLGVEAMSFAWEVIQRYVNKRL